MGVEFWEKVAVRIAASDPVYSGSKAQNLKPMLLCFSPSSMAVLGSWISLTQAPNIFVQVCVIFPNWILSPTSSRIGVG